MKLLILLFIILGSEIVNSQTAIPPVIGDGSVGSPYKIESLNNLYWLSQNSTEWNKHYIQTTNIDATTTNTWDSGSGFSPIGNNTTGFTGSYNGQLHNIDGLFIDRPSTDYVALFGSSGGTIEKLDVINVNIKGNKYVGGLVGSMTSSTTMNNCLTTGSVTGNDKVGGLIGSTFYASITNCYNSGTISGRNEVGGLVGANGQCWIYGSYNNGSVSGTDYVGGLVGFQGGYGLQNCYNFGSVAGNNLVGGLVGYFDYHGIYYCYSTGLVSGNSNVGGLVGAYAQGATAVRNSFWNTETSGQSTSSLGTGKNTAEMKNLATFTDETTAGLTTAWDFETNPNDDVADNDYWDIDVLGSFNEGYPFLSWQNGDDIALPVELTTFTASVSDNNVNLNWQTATEVNNYGFEIEKTTPNTDWIKICFIEGNGNSNSTKHYDYIDQMLNPGKYFYRLKQFDIDGSFEYSKTIEIDVNTISKFKLLQNYPNPFNPITAIKYSIPKQSKIKLIVYNVMGSEVAILINKEQPQGIYDIEFDGKNLTSGIYFYILHAEDFVETKKMILLK